MEGDSIVSSPMKKVKDIKPISWLTAENRRDHFLYLMGINSGLRASYLIT